MSNSSIVTFGEIMLRLSPPGYHKAVQANSFNIAYAGSEANVAVSLASMGETVEYVTALSSNDLGIKIFQEITKFSVGTEHVIKGDARQGLLFVEKGAMARSSNVIYDRDGTAFSQIRPGHLDWDEIFSTAKWFHWSGITPALSQNLYEVTKEAVLSASKAGVPISVDLNYRSNLWKYGKSSVDVMTDLTKHCDVLIGNEEDAEKCLGIKINSLDVSGMYQEISKLHYEAICEQTVQAFPFAKTICFTLRESINANHNRWSAILFNAGCYYHSNAYDLTHIVDRVGAGDSFSAAIIYGINHFGSDFQRILEFATAASALKHTIEGDFNLVSLEDIERMIQGNTSGRIDR